MWDGAPFLSRLFGVIAKSGVLIVVLAVWLANAVPVLAGVNLKLCGWGIAGVGLLVSWLTRGPDTASSKTPGPWAPLHVAAFACLMILVFWGDSRRPLLGIDIDLVVAVCCIVSIASFVVALVFPAKPGKPA